MKSIEVVPLTNETLIFEYIKKQIPFIVKTGLDLSQSTNLYLGQIGAQSVTVLQKVNNRGTRKNCLKKTLTLYEYLHGEDINKGWFFSGNIMKNKVFMNHAVELLKRNSLSLLSLVKHRRAAMVNLWISSGNKIEGLHNDPAVDNFNLQLMGKKTFYLAPPGNKAFYPGSLLSHMYHTSDVHNIFDYDKNLYPAFSNQLPEFYKGELLEGDLIFIPSFWWHQVHTNSEYISVNLNWWYVNPTTMRSNLRQTFAMWYLMLYRYLFQNHLT